MNPRNWTGIFKGAGGEYEVNRFVGSIGVLAFIVTVCGLTIFEVVFRERQFDIALFCAAFPAGLGVAIGAIAGAVAIKDRNVAKAKTETAAAAVVQAEADGP